MGARAMSLLVMCSALSAINGMILTGSRLFATWGADTPAIAWLGEWNRRRAAPFMAVGLQAAVAVALTLLVGTAAGRNAFDSALGRIGMPALPWDRFLGGFETLVAASTPVFWVFTLLTGIAVFRLRWLDAAIDRPFRIPLYPLPPIVFCATCVFMLWASVAYARWLTVLGIVPLVAGVIVWVLIRLARRTVAR
jgi:amino acid transporter